MQEKIDALRCIETPEGIELRLRTAGLIPRALAWSLDSLLRYTVLMFAGIGMSTAGGFGWGAFLILSFLLEWFYPVIFEVLRHGQTPGKARLGIRVVHDDGTPIGWSRSIIRNFLRFADFLPALYGAGIVAMLSNRDFKRLGDLAAGTIVVYSDEEKLQTPEELLKGEATGPRVTLSTEEQRLIIAWAERQSQLSDGRREELADLLEPLTERNGAAGTESLLQIARWSLGVTPADSDSSKAPL